MDLSALSAFGVLALLGAAPAVKADIWNVYERTDLVSEQYTCTVQGPGDVRTARKADNGLALTINVPYREIFGDARQQQECSAQAGDGKTSASCEKILDNDLWPDDLWLELSINSEEGSEVTEQQIATPDNIMASSSFSIYIPDEIIDGKSLSSLGLRVFYSRQQSLDGEHVVTTELMREAFTVGDLRQAQTLVSRCATKEAEQ